MYPQRLVSTDRPSEQADAASFDVAQMRAARALLGWKQRVLAERAGVSLAMIKNIERGVVALRPNMLLAIQGAFEAAGVIFLENGDTRAGGRGLRLREPFSR